MDLKLITNDNGVLEAQCDAPEWSQGDDRASSRQANRTLCNTQQ
jgi:hypothetical protein